VFSSNNKDREKLESFVGRNSQFTGDIATKGTLRVDGQITGNVEADWLILGAKALIKGNASVVGMVVGGTIEGNVTARELVEVKNKGQIVGDIVTTKLVVVEGGVILGRIAMQREGAKVVELQPEKKREGAASL
jgi:cytoskeletal protein CcmA (bactofilin family)